FGEVFSCSDIGVFGSARRDFPYFGWRYDSQSWFWNMKPGDFRQLPFLVIYWTKPPIEGGKTSPRRGEAFTAAFSGPGHKNLESSPARPRSRTGVNRVWLTGGLG